MGWFSKRKNDNVATGNRTLALAVLDVVQELDELVKAMSDGEKGQASKCLDRMIISKREADRIEDRLSIEIGDGTLSITEREDLLRLIRKTEKIAVKAYESGIFIQMAIETESQIPKDLWCTMRQMTTELVLAVKMVLKGYQALAAEDIPEIERCIDAIKDQVKHIGTEHINTFKKILMSDMDYKGMFLSHGFINDLDNSAEACKTCADMMSIIVSTRVI